MFSIHTSHPVRATITVVFTALLLVGARPAPPGATIVFVDDDASSGGDGSSWGMAYAFLQDALASAAAGTEIHVAQGSYRPDQDEAGLVTPGDRGATLQLLDDVALMGGFAGIGQVDPDARDIALFETILSGDLLGDDGPGFTNNGENSFSVTTGSGTATTAILDGFTITGGTGTLTVFSGIAGGGMLNVFGSPTVTRCTFLASVADHGGGMMNSFSSPLVADCTFEANLAANNGGGMQNFNSSFAVVTSCTFTGNTAGFNGGGMHNGGGSSPEVSGCTFEGNTGRFGGGMTNVASSTPTVVSCVFIGNHAAADGLFANGGGMDNFDSSPTVTDCTFSGNTAATEGGGMINTGSSPVVTNCSFTGNTAVLAGGGMDNLTGSAPWVTHCTFSGNTTTDGLGIGGGGMRNHSSSPKVEDCTFDGNVTPNRGGGMLNEFSGTLVAHCVFEATNAAQFGGGMANLNSSDVLVTGSAFRDNMASAEGGGMYNLVSSPTVANCTFSTNTANGSGGGMRNSNNSSPLVARCLFEANTADFGGGVTNRNNSNPVVIDCTFSGNVATIVGAGMRNNVASPTVTNCTFHGNVATNEGGGLHNVVSSAPSLSSCVLWNNSPDEIFEDASSAGLATVSYSTVQGGWVGTANLDVDPLFVNAGNGDLSLQPSSPAVDRGDPARIDAGTDGFGNARVLDGDLDQSMVIDMGSFEFSHVRLAVTGMATAGQRLIVEATGTPGLQGFLIVGMPGEGHTVPPFGSMFVDRTAPLRRLSMGTVPFSLQALIPSVANPGSVVMFQALAVQNGAGNLSNGVAVLFE